MTEAIQSMDFSILHAIQQNMRCDLLDFLMPKISIIASAGIIWIALAVVLLLIKKHRVCGLKMLAGLLSSLLIGNGLLKNVIARPRPSWLDPTVILLVANPRDFSFPSGHTLSSFISATILFRHDKRFGIPAFVLATIIAFSRLYLYVHFPTDVIAGALLGILIGILADILLQRTVIDRRAAKNENKK